METKKKKCSPGQGSDGGAAEDRISGLPDILIHRILSFLEMKDVIKTSLMSRRWRRMWASVPVLDFGSCRSAADTAFLATALALREEGREILRFRVALDGEVDAHHADSWIRFAAERRVEELDVDFFDSFQAGDGDLYKLPRSILDCRALRILKLGFCVLNLPPSFSFPSLTLLHLRCVEFTHLNTSGCPLLESLIIQDCTKNLNIYAPNQKLRLFKIIDSWGELFDPDPSLTLYAPHVMFIEFSGDFRPFYKFKKLSSIRRASLEAFRVEDHGADSKMLVQLLKHLAHAKTLELCQLCVEMLAYRKRNNLKSLDFSATCLELGTSLDKCELPGFASLLMSSHCLESLVINITAPGLSVEIREYFDDGSFDEVKSWELLERSLSANLQLKTVMIHNFPGSGFKRLCHGGEPSLDDVDKFLENCKEVRLIKLLLKGCKVLEKITINTAKMPGPRSELLLSRAKKLLVLPRASSNAEIHFA